MTVKRDLTDKLMPLERELSQISTQHKALTKENDELDVIIKQA
jgi:hypothetical protein